MRSPSHMMRMVPAVIVRIMMEIAYHVSLVRSGSVQLWSSRPLRARVMYDADCIAANPMVM